MAKDKARGEKRSRGGSGASAKRAAPSAARPRGAARPHLSPARGEPAGEGAAAAASPERLPTAPQRASPSAAPAPAAVAGGGAAAAHAAPQPSAVQPPLVDRRRQPRAPINIRIDYQTVDAFFSEFASNINQGGLYIKTNKPLPPGTQLNIQFLLPNNTRPIQVVGEVVWVNEKTTKGINPGMGIKFGELDAEAKAQINELVRSLRVS